MSAIKKNLENTNRTFLPFKCFLGWGGEHTWIKEENRISWTSGLKRFGWSVMLFVIIER